jgi:hypothetical protein
MIRRRAVLVVLPPLVMALLGAPVGAQLGNPLNKLRPQPAAPKRTVVQCQNITDKDIDQLLKALEAERAMRLAEQARRDEADRQQQATNNAVSQAAGERMMAAMARQQECEQAAMDKDPRSRDAERIGELRNKAQDRGDDTAADKYGEQFEQLTDAIEKAAKAACVDPACLARARQDSPFKKQIDELRAAAAKSGNAEQKAMFEAQIPGYLGMIEVDALQKCGPVGAAQLTADEQAQTDAAAAAAQSARGGREGSAAREAGMTDEDYGRIFDCACGALGDPNSVALSDQSRQVIERRKDELTPALERSGKCRRP